MWLIMNKNYLIASQLLLIVCINSVTMKSPVVFVLPPALLTFEYLPEHKLGCQQLNCCAVRRELITQTISWHIVCTVLGVCY